MHISIVLTCTCKHHCLLNKGRLFNRDKQGILALTSIDRQLPEKINKP